MKDSTTQSRRNVKYLSIVIPLAIIAFIAFSFSTEDTRPMVRRLEAVKQQWTDEQRIMNILTTMKDDMCSDEWKFRPLRYNDCSPNEKVNSIPLHGGLTNALKLILLGAIGSFEEGRCFIVDESKADLNKPDANGTRHGFLHKYMEPIGLPLNSSIVTKAKEEDRLVSRDWSEFWFGMHIRRAYGTKHFLPYAGYNTIEGHLLKRDMIRRLWRPLPEYRQASCRSMNSTHGLIPGEYMAFSIRRGDKTIEDFEYTDLKDYITEAEKQLPKFSSTPKIFVATDDCSVLDTFREMRPEWNFVSECDVQKISAGRGGFNLTEVADWSADAEKAHYVKFFTEIYALTLSKVFIGVSYTNLAWWIFFMRPFRHSFILLDKPEGQGIEDLINWW